MSTTTKITCLSLDCPERKGGACRWETNSKLNSLYKMVFDWTDEKDIETKLRVIIANARGNVEPKAVYTDLIEMVYANNRKAEQLKTIDAIIGVFKTPPVDIAEEDIHLVHWHHPDLMAAFNDMRIAIEAGELLK